MRGRGFYIGAAIGSLAIASAARADEPPRDTKSGDAKSGEAKTGDEDVEVRASTGDAKTADATEIEALKKRIDALEKRLGPAPSNGEPSDGDANTDHREEKSAPPEESGVSAFMHRVIGTSAFDIGAYVQGQYEWHQDSVDQLQQGGAPLNQDRFLVRRGRFRVEAAWEWTALSLEFDGSTTKGASFSVRRAEASLVWRGPWGPKASDLEALHGDGPAPLMMLSVGVTEIPFGYELADSARARYFMERSQGNLAFFPGEPDVGARLSGGAAFFRYSLAVLNGEPIDERTGGREWNSAKDFVGRVGVDLAPSKKVRVTGGVSALRGFGFHPGTDATKDTPIWTDTNENGQVDKGEITGSPGAAATPSKNFDRWAVGVDAEFRADTVIGTTRVYGEATLADNLDRGLFVADPVQTGTDLRELSVYAAFVQQISKYAFVGFRFDHYDPNGDFFDSQKGKLIPTSQSLETFSPIVGAEWPNRGRVTLQYDHVLDHLARNAQAELVDLPNDRFTARLQVQL